VPIEANGAFAPCFHSASAAANPLRPEDPEDPDEPEDPEAEAAGDDWAGVAPDVEAVAGEAVADDAAPVEAVLASVALWPPFPELQAATARVEASNRPGMVK
jgi:hypothetical protein